MQSLLDQKTIIRNFDRAAQTYDEASVWQREIAERLLDRLEWVRLAPQVILDIGARTGYTTQLLAARYPQAKILATDWSRHFLSQLSQNAPQAWRLSAEPECLPLQTHCADLIIINLAWHWLQDYRQCLREWRRVLKPDGLLLFTACGPDTLYELRASFAAVDDAPHVHLFLDMHDIGDAVLAAGFTDPVMQAEHLCFTYSAPEKLWRDLRATGVVNALKDRRRGLMGKNLWRQMQAEYAKFGSPQSGWPATVEVVYGLAWGEGASLARAESGEVLIPVANIGRQRVNNDE